MGSSRSNSGGQSLEGLLRRVVSHGGQRSRSVSLRASPGNKGLCLLKGSCFHPETKTFVSFDAGGGSTDMMSQLVRLCYK